MLDYPLCAQHKALSCIAPSSSVAIVKDVYTLIFLSSLPDQRGVPIFVGIFLLSITVCVVGAVVGAMQLNALCGAQRG